MYCQQFILDTSNGDNKIADDVHYFSDFCSHESEFIAGSLYKTGSKNSNHTSNDSFLHLGKMTTSKNLSYYCCIMFSIFSVCPNF